jgi:hypothetical protein
MFHGGPPPRRRQGDGEVVVDVLFLNGGREVACGCHGWELGDRLDRPPLATRADAEGWQCGGLSDSDGSWWSQTAWWTTCRNARAGEAIVAPAAEGGGRSCGGWRRITVGDTVEGNAQSIMAVIAAGDGGHGVCGRGREGRGRPTC